MCLCFSQQNDTVSQAENAMAHSSADKTSNDDPEWMPVSQAETTESVQTVVKIGLFFYYGNWLQM